MSSVLLIVAGCSLVCAWLLWVDILTPLAAVAALGSAGITLAALANAGSESTFMKAYLVLLAVNVFMCAGCVLVAGYLDERSRIRGLLRDAMWVAVMAAFVALLGAVIADPEAREAVSTVLEGLLVLVVIVVTAIVVLGFMLLMDGGGQSAPRRPKGMSRQVWNRQQKQWREYKRKHSIDRSGGAGYSGGSRGDSGYDGYGGVSGDGGDGGGGD